MSLRDITTANLAFVRGKVCLRPCCPSDAAGAVALAIEIARTAIDFAVDAIGMGDSHTPRDIAAVSLADVDDTAGAVRLLAELATAPAPSHTRSRRELNASVDSDLTNSLTAKLISLANLLVTLATSANRGNDIFVPLARG